MEEPQPADYPIVAIIGRPNVGKSTLFNRLIGARRAITSAVAGTTRDRIYQKATFGKHAALLVDTGGLAFGKREDIEADTHTQTLIAINEAHIVLLVLDASQELTAADFDATQLLRKANKPTIVVAHKADRKDVETNQFNLYELGLGEPIIASALHNIGIDQLLHEIGEQLKKIQPNQPQRQADNNVIAVCFLGKPNVGKSSLVNALCGEERIIVSETPGTTRDSTDTELTYNSRTFNFIDTAGMRRSGKVRKGIERWSVMRSLESIVRSDICLLILDAAEGIAHQDLKVSSYILEAGKGLIVVMNKADLENVKEEKDALVREAQRKMVYMPWAPLIFVSAKNRANLTKLMDLCADVFETRRRKVLDKDLEYFLHDLATHHPPRGMGKPELFSVRQTNVAPPTFTFFTSNPRAFHFSYRRYMENALRERFGFNGTPLKIILKRGEHGM